jgi:DNA polymerase-3 subunit epsilon
MFHERKEADSLLRELAQQYQLCPRRLGLESGRNGACQAHQARRCAGVCAGKETIAAHDERLLGALGVVRIKPWPWAGAVALAERCTHSGREAFHLFDHWCHLGSADSKAGLRALHAESSERRFDLDTYRLLSRWLASEAHREAVIDLVPSGAREPGVAGL